MMLKLFLILFLMTSSAVFSADTGPVVTVPELTIEKYLGKWHQIAAIPAWFQRNCTKNTTAEYLKTSDGLIKVENRCEKEDGEISTAEGVARLNPKFDSPSKLQVTFVSIFGHWIWAFGGNYWVMDLGKSENSYEYSVVGDPKREYLWILARKPQLTIEELILIREKIKFQYYDLEKIILTQEGDLYGKNLAVIEP